MGLDESVKQVQASETPTRTIVSNGNLLYASYPLLAGHFEGDSILYAENAIDNILDGALKKRHQLNIYPGKIGTSKIVFSSNNKFKGAIIAGLGKPGTLTAFQFSLTMEQAVASYLLTLNAQPGKNISVTSTGISSLIVGCGYGGLSVSNSVQAIIEAVQKANNKIKKLHGDNAFIIEEIEFVEKYEDTALNCFYSLTRIGDDQSKSLSITLNNKIKFLAGRARRMPHDEPQDWWNRITIRNLKLDKNDDKENTVRTLHFSASTGGAREELRQLYSSTNIVEQLVDDISTSNQWSASLAKTVFELLIPNDFKEQLKKQCNINLILDAATAEYPWELLQDNAADTRPLSVNAGMIRQLATEEYRVVIKDVSKLNALIISEPDLKGFAPPLPEALKKGQLVESILKDKEFTVTHIPKGSPHEIIKALFQDDYKIIHLVGHGVFNGHLLRVPE